jgi:hypothetical protein
VRNADLRRFAAKISQTVENDREKFSAGYLALPIRSALLALIASADCN